MRVDAASAPVAIVTGASSGIGRAIAIELGSRGYSVCVNYHRGGSAARDVVTAIAAAGGRGFAQPADVSNAGEVGTMVEATVRRYGGVDLLVNNAGVERAAALELAPFGIGVVGIGPGAVATPINAKTLADPQLKAALEREIPLGRVGTPEEVAKLVAYVASADAAYVTGTTIFIDGGLMHQAGRL